MSYISLSKSTSLVMTITSQRLAASDRMSYFTIKTNYRGRGRPLYYMRGFHAVVARCERGLVYRCYQWLSC